MEADWRCAMRRKYRATGLPSESDLQDAVWEDESPAPAPDPSQLHPPQHDAPEHGRSLFTSIAFWFQWVMLQMFGPAQQDEAHDPIELLKRKYHRT